MEKQTDEIIIRGNFTVEGLDDYLPKRMSFLKLKSIKTNDTKLVPIEFIGTD